MKKLSPKELFGSLIFPVLVLLPCLILILVLFPLTLAQLLSGERVFEVLFFWAVNIAGIVCGGVLPIVLTVKTQMDTSKYLVNRFGILFVTAVLVVGSSFIAEYFNAPFLPVIILIASIIVSAVYHIRKADRHREWIIICLSDPILYFLMNILVIFTFAVVVENG
ncbi:MAG: hypothetical protein J1F60_05750 [Oscillospiraceae bacterium]|nr:hypothetical protein [Oscillospiraceae bacterium]